MTQRPRFAWFSLCSLLACNGVSSLGSGRDGRPSAGNANVEDSDAGGASGGANESMPSAARGGAFTAGATNNGGTRAIAGEGGRSGVAGEGGRSGVAGIGGNRESAGTSGAGGGPGDSAGLGSGASAGAGMPSVTELPLAACEHPPALDGFPEITLPGNAIYAVTGDFNHDARLDVAVLSDASTVSAFFGAGDGTLGSRSDYRLDGEAGELVVGDVNGDGNSDLLTVGGTLQSTVGVLLGKTDGSFVAGTSYSVNGSARSLMLADFNADHVPDLAFVEVVSSTTSLLFGHGDGTFDAPLVSSVAGSGAGVASGDLNGDGAADLVSVGGASIAVWLNRGDGTFGGVNTYAAGGGDDRKVWILDFDGDGKRDIVMETGCAPAPGDGVFILRGRGDGTFAQSAVAGDACDNGPSLPLGADFDGDGKFDLLDRWGTVSFSRGDGTFDERAAQWQSLPGMALAAGDFDGDGKADVVTGADDRLALRLGNGQGAFGGGRSFSLGIFVGGATPSQILLDDVNLDGQLDLIVANTEPPSLGVMYGAGDGSFGAAANYRFDETDFAPDQPLAPELTGVVSTELNHDGRPDFLLVDGNTSNVGVLLSTAASSYVVDSMLAMGDGSFAATVADLNGDHELDLITANARDATLSVRFGKGDGTFGGRFDRAVDFVDGDGPDAVVTGDVNGDGRVDAIVTTWGHDARVLFGNGDGTFTNGPSYPAGGSPSLVALNDFDRDGILDLALTTSSSVRILRGAGDGTFAGAADYPIHLYSSSLSLGDVDGDGNVDIVVEGDGFDVLFGNGDGTFSCSQSYETGSATGSLSLGDVNGDGTLDVVTMSNADATVFLNPRR